MPNPVVALNSQFYQNYSESSSQLTFKYNGPARTNTGPGGSPVTFCAAIGPYSYQDLQSQTPYNLVRKNGYKHTPYRSESDNHHPLAYSLLKWTYIRPSLKCNGLSIKHRHSGFGIDCQEVSLPPVTFSTGSIPSFRYAAVDQALENQAIADLNSSINDQRAISVNWAMTYAERRDTISMLNKRMAQLIVVLRNLRRGRYEKSFEQLFGKKPTRRQKKRWQKKARTKDRAASLWLEWTYGWSPLINDVYGAMNDLVKTPKPLILRCTGKAVRFDNSTESFSSAFGSGGIIPTVKYPLNIERKSSIYFTSYYRVDHKSFASAAGAGLTNPASLVWELIPFSFVFDWFVNMGDVLEDITIAHGFTHLHTIKSEKKKTVATISQPCRVEYVVPTSYTVNGEGNVYYYEERTEFNRVISATRPRIYLGLNTQPLSIRRLISATALLNQLGKGLFAKGRN